MSGAHTPGPWVWSGGQLLSDQRAKMYSETILVVDRPEFNPSEADARLITAAPRLLAALRELHLKAVVGTDDERHAALNEAWAAITDATGAA